MTYGNHGSSKQSGKVKEAGVRSVAKTGSSTKALRDQAGTRSIEGVKHDDHTYGAKVVGQDHSGPSGRGAGGRGPIGS